MDLKSEESAFLNFSSRLYDKLEDMSYISFLPFFDLTKGFEPSMQYVFVSKLLHSWLILPTFRDLLILHA